MNTNKALVKLILNNPFNYEWSIQGFGMLRLYLTQEIRLHIWNSAFKVKDVSVVHTHPWDFISEIILGKITNIRYEQVNFIARQFTRTKILCGMGGGICKGEIKDQFEKVNLVANSPEVYTEGEIYTQRAEEIHESIPDDGTVTIVTRKFKSDKDHAYVYWEKGDWVSAEPRKATKEEIKVFVNKALSLYDPN